MKRNMMAAVGLGGVLIGLGFGQAAVAQTQPAVIPMEQVLTQLKADGYGEIYEIERESGRYEVKAKNADGQRVELYVDAQTGETLKVDDD